MLWEAQDRRRHNHQCYNQSRQAGSENTIVGIQLICFDEDARLATGDDVVVGHVNHHNNSCPSAAGSQSGHPQRVGRSSERLISSLKFGSQNKIINGSIYRFLLNYVD